MGIHYSPPILYERELVELPLFPSYIMWEGNSGNPLFLFYIIGEGGTSTIFLLYMYRRVSWNSVILSQPQRKWVHNHQLWD